MTNISDVSEVTIIGKKTLQLKDITLSANKKFFLGISTNTNSEKPNRTIDVCDLDGNFIRSFEIVGNHIIHMVDITPDDKYLVSCSSEGTIKFFDFATGALVKVWISADMNLKPGVFVLSPSGKLIAFNANHRMMGHTSLHMLSIENIMNDILDDDYVAEIPWYAPFGFLSNDNLYFTGSRGIYVAGISRVPSERPDNMVEVFVALKHNYSSDVKYSIKSLAIDRSTNKYAVLIIDENTGSVFIDVFYEDNIGVHREIRLSYLEDKSEDDEFILEYSPDGKFLSVNDLSNRSIVSVFNMMNNKPPFDVNLSENHTGILSPRWITNDTFITYHRDEISFWKILPSRKSILMNFLRQGYKDSILRSEHVFKRELPIEILKEFGKEIGLPGWQEYDNVEILRAMLIAYREISIKVKPQEFTNERELEDEIASSPVVGALSTF
jgi:WD40 repeat protein